MLRRSGRSGLRPNACHSSDGLRVDTTESVHADSCPDLAMMKISKKENENEITKEKTRKEKEKRRREKEKVDFSNRIPAP